MNLVPLRFLPVYIHKPWGGRRLEAFKGALPPGDVGETWDVSAHPQGDTVAVGGKYDGVPLSTLAERLGGELVGHRCVDRPFPLMVRYVSSRENLSIQLHPTASHARKTGQSSGKDEAWYVLDAAPDAFVYAGLRECTREQFRSAAAQGTLAELAVRRPVRAGDFLYIPAGTVHAICAGITLIELCENSNTTYRLFDHGRDRGLDLADGYEVVDVDAAVAPHRGLTWHGDGHDVTYLCLTERFATTRVDVWASVSASTDAGSFQVFTCVEGALTLDTAGAKERLRPGESVLLPAGLGAYDLHGSGSVLETHVPDVTAERAALAARLA